MDIEIILLAQITIPVTLIINMQDEILQYFRLPGTHQVYPEFVPRGEFN